MQLLPTGQVYFWQQPGNESCTHNTEAWEDASVNLEHKTHKYANGYKMIQYYYYVKTKNNIRDLYSLRQN